MTYNAKNAMVDLGFIEGYARVQCLPGDDLWFDHFMEALERIQDYIVKGNFLTNNATTEEFASFLHDLGFMRGSLWNDKIPYGVSEMLRNVVSYVTGHHEHLTDRPEAKEAMLSDAQRDTLCVAAEEGEDLFRMAFSGEINASEAAIVRYTSQELGAGDHDQAQEWAAESRKEWEAEQVPAPPARGTDPVTKQADEIEVTDAPSYVLPEYSAMPRSHYLWEPWQKEKLMAMRAEGASWQEIGEVVGKTKHKCSSMWFNERNKMKAGTSAAIEEPPTSVPVEPPVPIEEPDAVREFLAKGGKITKLPTRAAEGAIH